MLAPIFAGVLALMCGIEEAYLRPQSALTTPWASAWLGSCLAVSVAWGGVLAICMGAEAASTYGLCLGLNVLLSPDNVIVFMYILKNSQLPPDQHYRAISHGMFCAISFRVIALAGGEELIQRYSWIQLVLAFALIVNGTRLVYAGDQQQPPSNPCTDNWLLLRLSSLVPLDSSDANGDAYMVRRKSDGRLSFTLLAATVLALGFADMGFAVDSISAVLGETNSITLAVMSQILSMLLLRPCCFLLASLLQYIDSLNHVLGVILLLIGAKILLAAVWFEVPLWFFVCILTVWRAAAAFRAYHSRQPGTPDAAGAVAGTAPVAVTVEGRTSGGGSATPAQRPQESDALLGAAGTPSTGGRT